MENNTLFTACNNAIKRIQSHYPSYMRSCLYSHEDEEVLKRLYEITHILLNGETPEETLRRREIIKAENAIRKAKISAVRCSALDR
ncbi:MAG: hypothetical protein IKB98_05160 [Clostridia bacterium]|nr:hypothetical protein [Clostridia bacterium]